MTTFFGLIGTYTKGNSEGIYSFTFDADSGILNHIKVAATIENPTYMALSKNNQYVYSVVKDGEYGGVAAFSINDKSGELNFINRHTEIGPSPCHVYVDTHNKYVLTGNYHKGTITIYQINQSNGGLMPESVEVQHKAPHANQKSHIHYTTFTPDGNSIAVVDLGIDQLTTYKLIENQLVKVSNLQLRDGCGPRHLVFHPSSSYAYLMTEYSSEVIVLHYNEATGVFKEIQTISTLPDDFSKNNQGSAIHITSDGRFVYAGNRGHNSIAIFEVNQETYQLTFINHISTEGNWPRDFALDPTEQYIIASNQESCNLTVFKRDNLTGKLRLLEAGINVPHPVCIKFINPKID